MSGNAASSHDCVCLHAPGYRPKVCECSVYTDEHGDWCGNENCRAPLNRGAHLTTLTRLSEELPGGYR